MFKLKRIYLILIAILLLSACFPAKTTTSVNLQDQINQTMQAVATDVQSTLKAAEPVSAPATRAPLPTYTAQPTYTPYPTQVPLPTATPVPPQALAPAAVTATATSQPVVVSATGVIAHMLANVNCRTGTSEAFPVVFVALAGSDVSVASKTASGDYLLVQDPYTAGQTCWVLANFTNVKGDLAGLAVTNPPPTPVPNVRYDVTYVETQPCSGWTVYSLAFQVKNTGVRLIHSYKFVVTDLTAGTTIITTNNIFGQRANCVTAPDNLDYLDPGQSGWMYADKFTADPYHHTLLVYLTVCDHNDLAGECASESFFLTP